MDAQILFTDDEPPVMVDKITLDGITTTGIVREKKSFMKKKKMGGKGGTTPNVIRERGKVRRRTKLKQQKETGKTKLKQPKKIGKTNQKAPVRRKPSTTTKKKSVQKRTPLRKARGKGGTGGSRGGGGGGKGY